MIITMGIVSEDMFRSLRAESCSDARDVLAALKACERAEAMLLSCKARLVAMAAEKVAERKLAEERQGGKGIFSFSIREAAILELAPALGVSSREAKGMLSFAENMTEHYPKLGARLAAGEVTAKTARLVGKSLESAPAGWREKLDVWLAERAPRWRLCSQSKVQGLIEAQYVRWDSEWTRERREKAHAERGLFFQPVGDGMAKIWGAMPLMEAAMVKDKLDAVARTVCPGDPRAMWTRRSDALAALAGHGEDKLRCECGRDTCKAAQRPVPQAKPVELVVDLAVLANLSDLPAWLDGSPIDPELAQKLAKASKTIRFTTTPEQYKPTQAVETHVNARDKHCRFPGCHRRARTELDHTHPFNHHNPASGGQTVPQNIKRLCRHHHRAKTHGKWRDTQNPDGTITWTSPTGQHYTTNPG
ncbi:HNH endonuclease signature motif containing protein [Segniliparus rugosus]|uniref:DUF222 domain-containing protein n=1 Tax=Segniliparus rugosus (strain ATCC BAA-974 / DSM 45345 / CCUG 50838 / CIP 108380 / JCM 13579 / CDC 945) TaxID=679197 RepID=U1N535_SEGRC|nr:HNH endonuclease signature motif containing protein [Segniliparus rugosus]ERG69284.1 hypothetical protein HMPREF9336_04175 [Segniliparus rugosus ATCC BAA-974]